jgi:hypothetical protein
LGTGLFMVLQVSTFGAIRAPSLTGRVRCAPAALERTRRHVGHWHIASVIAPQGMSGVGCRPDLLLITRNRQLASIENDRRRARRSSNARATGLNAPRAGEPPGSSIGGWRVRLVRERCSGPSTLPMAKARFKRHCAAVLAIAEAVMIERNLNQSRSTPSSPTGEPIGVDQDVLRRNARGVGPRCWTTQPISKLAGKLRSGPS